MAHLGEIWDTGRPYIILVSSRVRSMLSPEARQCVYSGDIIPSYYDDRDAADLWAQKNVHCDSIWAKTVCLGSWSFEYGRPRADVMAYQREHLAPHADTFQVSQFIWYYASQGLIPNLLTSSKTLAEATTEGLHPEAASFAAQLHSDPGGLNVFLLDWIDGDSITRAIWNLNAPGSE